MYNIYKQLFGFKDALVFRPDEKVMIKQWTFILVGWVDHLRQAQKRQCLNPTFLVAYPGNRNITNVDPLPEGISTTTHPIVSR